MQDRGNGGNPGNPANPGMRSRPVDALANWGVSGNGRPLSLPIRPTRDIQPNATVNSNSMPGESIRNNPYSGASGNNNSSNSSRSRNTGIPGAAARSALPPLKHRVILAIEIDPNLVSPCCSVAEYEKELFPFALKAATLEKEKNSAGI